MAILFLFCAGFVAIALDLYAILEDQNLFKTMHVSRTAGDKEIRAAYKSLARELHPDRNSNNPNAEAEFNQMQLAYETLIDPVSRDIFDKWGYEGLKWGPDRMAVLYSGLMSVSIVYVMWFALTILLTVNSSNTHARSICAAGLCLIIALDLHMRTETFNLYVPFFPHVAVHQLGKLLFTIYPTFISGTIVFQNFTYVDPVERNWMLLSRLFHRMNSFEENFRILEDNLRSAQKSGLNVSAGKIASSAHIPAATASAASSLPRPQQARVEKPEIKPLEKKTGIPSWLFLVGMYVLFNYVLK